MLLKGAGADIDIDKYGIRATRKTDGKKTFEIDAETGDVHFEGDGVFRGRVEASEGYFHGRVEAEEGYFRGDITGATGTFSGELAAKSIKAEWFEEIRNVLPYTGQDSLDSGKPIVIPFYIPSETTKIVAAFLSAEARRNRAYSKSAPYDPSAFWDKQTSGTSFDSPPVTVTLNTTNADTGQTSLDHYHQYSDTHITTSASGGHSHAINTSAWPKLNTDYSAPDNHRHTLDSFVIPNNSGTHTHSTTNTNKNTGGSQTGVLTPNNLSHNHSYERVTGATLSNFTNHHHDYDPAHDHKLEFGIHEDTTPANVRMRVNDGSGWSGYITLASAASGNAAYDLISGASVPKHNNNASEMDLTPYLSGTGWKYIEFSSSRLGLIAWNLILKLDITA
jgi:hypothetical protein